MRSRYLASRALILLILLSTGTAALSQDIPPIPKPVNSDPLGERDTLFVEINRVDDNSWTINLSTYNDYTIFGISIPLRLTAGLRKVLIDSIVFTGGRVEHFELPLVRIDTAIQCLTVGLIAGLNPQVKPLAIGRGRIATIFAHSLGEGRAPALKVDTITTAPSNSLLFINSEMKPDTDQYKILPAFVVTTVAESENQKK